MRFALPMGTTFFMTFLVSGVATWRAIGPGESLMEKWMTSWLIAWFIANGWDERGSQELTKRFRNIESAHNTTFKIDSVVPTTAASLSGTLGNNGWYTSTPVGVTLTATDATSGVASVTYKLDGGASTAYTAPFAVTRTSSMFGRIVLA